MHVRGFYSEWRACETRVPTCGSLLLIAGSTIRGRALCDTQSGVAARQGKLPLWQAPASCGVLALVQLLLSWHQSSEDNSGVATDC
jgi:hypothetical protein